MSRIDFFHHPSSPEKNQQKSEKQSKGHGRGDPLFEDELLKISKTPAGKCGNLWYFTSIRTTPRGMRSGDDPITRKLAFKY